MPHECNVEIDQWTELPMELWTHIFTIAGREWKLPISMTCNLFKKACAPVKVYHTKCYICDENAPYFSMTFLKWWILKKKRNVDAHQLCLAAARCGWVEALEWMLVVSRCEPKPSLSADAAMEGQLNVLKWIKERGIPFDEDCFDIAVMKGQLKVAMWLKENGISYCDDSCMWVATNGQLYELKWLREIGAPWDERTCACAARGGHLNVLKWARENGCPWDLYACANAAKGGHFEVLKWLRENGCPWSSAVMDCAKDRKHLDIYYWAKENGCPPPREYSADECW